VKREVKSGNERKSIESMTSSHHDPYELGYTRATKVKIKKDEGENRSINKIYYVRIKL